MKYNTIQYNTIQSKRLEGGGGSGEVPWLTNRLIKIFICEDELDGVKCDGKCYEGTPGADPGGGVLGVRTPAPFWGTPKLHKEGGGGKTLCACA